MDLLQEVQSAQPGSDIYGVKEKMAYYLHLKNNQKSADENWFEAEEKLLEMFGNIQLSGGGKVSLSYTLKKNLDSEAYFYSRYLDKEHNLILNTPFDSWIKAVDSISLTLINSYP